MALSPKPIAARKVVPHPSVPVVQPPDEFWPRIRRATALLLSAIVLHVFVVRAPRTDLVPLSVAGTVSSQAYTEDITAAAATRKGTAPIARDGAAGRTGADRVHIVTDSIRVVETHELDTWRGRRQAAPPADPNVLRADSRGNVPVLVHVADKGPDVAGTASLHPAQQEAASPGHNATDATPPLVARMETAVASGSRVPEPADAVAPEPAAHDTGRRLDPAAALQNEKQLVLRVIQEYRSAYERLDVAATKAVYPSVDDKRLQQVFRGLKGQQLRLGNCRLSISGQDANAWCPGEATIRTKVGSRTFRYTGVEWNFSLSRGDGEWQIRDATMMQPMMQ